MDFDFMVHLEDLSKDELERLINNEEKINDFIMDDERITSKKQERDAVMAKNRSLADDNLGKEPKLLQLKSDLVSRYEELKKHRDTYDTNQARLASMTKEENLDGMLAVLQARSAESEERTEALAEMLNSSGIEIANFISEFKSIRKLAHLRRAKVDKMKELILEFRRNEVHTTASYPAAPQPAPRSSSGRASLPHVSSQPAVNTPYPSYPGYGHPSAQRTSSFPHAHSNQPYPPAGQPYQPAGQQYSQYHW